MNNVRSVNWDDYFKVTKLMTAVKAKFFLYLFDYFSLNTAHELHNMPVVNPKELCRKNKTIKKKERVLLRHF
jgi:hypothetical protein